MKKTVLYFYFSSFYLLVSAGNDRLPIENDTSNFKSYQLQEIEIISNPKANSKTFEFPGSISIIGDQKIESLHLITLKDASSLVPNLYIPDYGSKLISSVYIRGIGSRINSPAVGLNVDNVPYLDKSSFDFDFMNIEKIEILRGPQGTLYGRNTMAGLINVYTKSPFDNPHTKVKVGYGNYNYFQAALSHSQKINQKFAYSISGKYRREDGYFKNSLDGKRSGESDVAGGRAQLYWRVNQRLKINLSSDFEYSNQNGYPYGLYDKEQKQWKGINYNDKSSYERKLSSNSLFLQYIHDRYILSSTTGYQYLSDNMHMDQDFSPLSIFTLQQKQRQHGITQEVAFRSNTVKNLQWVAGIFGFYSNLATDGPVDFKKDGLTHLVENNINKIFEGLPIPVKLHLGITSNNLFIDGRYKTPTFGLAVFKQITYNNLFTEGLSGTIGLRLDYEHTEINHNTRPVDSLYSDFTIQLPPQMGNQTIKIPLNVLPSVEGNSKMDFLELLPKFELKYTFDESFFIYASVAKGYRSGGYNFQMFSNIIQEKMQSLMMEELVSKIPPQFAGMMPDMGGNTSSTTSVKDLISYKPEHSWNYEIGGRAQLLDKKLLLDLSAFYIDCRNQQISIVSGYGRITKNTGHSASKGLETTIRFFPMNNLQFSAAYGFTHATFIENNDGKVNYKNNYVPFAPQNTLSVTAGYSIPTNLSWLDRININAQFTGRGRTYWTEANDAYQNFYGLLNGDISFVKGGLELNVWGKNILNHKYQAFYFETMNATERPKDSSFVQLGRPATIGVDISYRF